MGDALPERPRQAFVCVLKRHRDARNGGTLGIQFERFNGGDQIRGGLSIRMILFRGRSLTEQDARQQTFPVQERSELVENSRHARYRGGSRSESHGIRFARTVCSAPGRDGGHGWVRAWDES